MINHPKFKQRFLCYLGMEVGERRDYPLLLAFLRTCEDLSVPRNTAIEFDFFAIQADIEKVVARHGPKQPSYRGKFMKELSYLREYYYTYAYIELMRKRGLFDILEYEIDANAGTLHLKAKFGSPQLRARMNYDKFNQRRLRAGAKRRAAKKEKT